MFLALFYKKGTEMRSNEDGDQKESKDDPKDSDSLLIRIIDIVSLHSPLDYCYFS